MSPRFILSGKAPRIFVIDTNIVLADPDLDGVQWQRLQLITTRTSARLVVPEVVVREVARRRLLDMKRRRTEGVKQWGVAIKALHDARIELPDNLPTVSDLRARPQRSMEELATQLRETLESKGASIGPIPTTLDHDQLVTWSLQGHPPFDETDKGYRDALIWATVCDVAVAAATPGIEYPSDPGGPEVVLVTADSDFCGSDGELHHLLVDHVKHVSVVKVSIAKSIDSAIEFSGLTANSSEAPIDVEVADFDVPSAEDLLRSSVETECDRLVGEPLLEKMPSGDLHSRLVELDLDPDLEDPAISGVAPYLDSLSVDTHEVFDGGTQVGEVTVSAEIEYEGYKRKADYFGETARDLRLVDSDFNDQYVALAGEFTAEVIFQFVLDDTGVQALEFVSAELT